MCLRGTEKPRKQVFWEYRSGYRSGVFIVNFKNILHFFPLFLPSTSNMYLFAGNTVDNADVTVSIQTQNLRRTTLRARRSYFSYLFFLFYVFVLPIIDKSMIGRH